MTISRLICELTKFLAEHGDLKVTTVQHENDGNYAYGDIRHIVDYENGTMGLVGEREGGRIMSGRYIWKVYNWRGDYVGTYGSWDAADREVSRNGGHWERVYDPGCNSDYDGCINSVNSPGYPTHYSSTAGEVKFD